MLQASTLKDKVVFVTRLANVADMAKVLHDTGIRKTLGATVTTKTFIIL